MHGPLNVSFSWEALRRVSWQIVINVSKNRGAFIIEGLNCLGG